MVNQRASRTAVLHPTDFDDGSACAEGHPSYGVYDMTRNEAWVSLIAGDATTMAPAFGQSRAALVPRTVVGRPDG